MKIVTKLDRAILAAGWLLLLKASLVGRKFPNLDPSTRFNLQLPAP